jgi:hypothetical protein
MNTAEKIVESYFRHCLGCFTMTDVKVEGGNNRQLDLVAFSVNTGDSFHVEITVKIVGFAPTLPKLKDAFDRKFFGSARVNDKETGDYALGKNYRRAVQRTYRRLGLTPSRVRRVYVCWDVVGSTQAELERFLTRYSRQHRLGRNPIEVWSFRDRVLPELREAVGSSNYSDDALRTLSLLAAAERGRSAR